MAGTKNEQDLEVAVDELSKGGTELGNELHENSPIFEETKSTHFKGALGKVACQRFLLELDLEAEVISSTARGKRSMYLLAKDPLCVATSTSKAVISCRGGIRNTKAGGPYNLPENDRELIHRIDRNEAAGLGEDREKEAEIRGADLLYSLTFFYPQTEYESLLFIFLTTEKFMEKKCKPKSDNYSMLTREKLDDYARYDSSEEGRSGPNGFLFAPYSLATDRLLEIARRFNSKEINSIEQLLKEYGKVHLERKTYWRDWKRTDRLTTK
jgi:hypothetical protein